MKDNFEALLSLPFNAEQIVQIVGHNGGSKNLAAVTDNFEALKALNFSAEQIVKIVGHRGGSRNLAAVMESFEVLKALNFTAEQIVKIASHDGGSYNLKAVIAHCAELKQSGLTNKDIVTQVSRNSGSKRLLSVVEQYREQDTVTMLTRMATDSLDVTQVPRQDKGSLVFICNSGNPATSIGHEVSSTAKALRMHGVLGDRQASKRAVSDAELAMTTAPAAKKVKQ